MDSRSVAAGRRAWRERTEVFACLGSKLSGGGLGIARQSELQWPWGGL